MTHFLKYGASACLTITFLIMIMLLSACSGSDRLSDPMPPSSASNTPDEITPYKIGPGDKIDITVYAEPELSSSYTVSNTGHLSFPLVGQILISDFTLQELEAVLKAKLSEGYLKDPSISAEINEFRPFYIMGEVRSPGSYNYVSGIKIVNAVAMAGGYTYRADKGSMEILRKKGVTEKVLREQNENTEIMPGDVILVRERFF